MIQRAWKYGLFCALFLIGIFAFNYLRGTNPFLDRNLFLVDIVLFAVFVWFAAKEFKIYAYRGFLHFWQGMTIGFFVYTIAIFAYGVVLSIYLTADGEFLAFHQSSVLSYYESNRDLFVEKWSQEEFDKAIEVVNATTNWDLIRDAVIKKLFAAVIPTPIVALILRKKPKQD
ncbi:MAG: DUF4199 domain-containing protein [Bacteroidota bacterium]